jgi:hypothetical protein
MTRMVVPSVTILNGLLTGGGGGTGGTLTTGFLFEFPSSPDRLLFSAGFEKYRASALKSFLASPLSSTDRSRGTA